MIVNIPDMKAIEDEGNRKGWSRQEMYDHYCAELARTNPYYFNADGTKKTLWQSFKGLFA